MLDQIQDLIRKNLPGEVGDTLRKHLQDAEQWKKDLDIAKRTEEGRVKQVEQYGVKVAGLEARLMIAGDLDKREAEVRKRENALEVTLAQKRAESAEYALMKVTELTALVFRNPTFVHTERKSVPIVMPSGGGYINQGEETREVKKTQE